jgi:hypothetical protein
MDQFNYNWLHGPESLRSSSASQEIHRLLWNPKVHCRGQNSPPLVPILSHMKPVHTIEPSFMRLFDIYSYTCYWLLAGFKYIGGMATTVHRLRVGETVVVGKQVALSILLPFQCNISFNCTAQKLVLSYQRWLTVVLACIVVAGGWVKLPRYLSICKQYEKLTVTQLVKKFHTFLEPEDSLQVHKNTLTSEALCSISRYSSLLRWELIRPCTTLKQGSPLVGCQYTHLP